jgi:hypothetical protein
MGTPGVMALGGEGPMLMRLVIPTLATGMDSLRLARRGGESTPRLLVARARPATRLWKMSKAVRTSVRISPTLAA